MGEQILFENNKLRIQNPTAPLVSNIVVPCDKEKYADMLDLMSGAIKGNKCVIKTIDKELDIGNETDLTMLKQRGFIYLTDFNEHDIYIGKLPETNIDIVILHDVKDGRSVKQVYLSPRLHSRKGNLEYIEELKRCI